MRMNSGMEPGHQYPKLGQDLCAKNPETVFQKENPVISIMAKTRIVTHMLVADTKLCSKFETD